MEGRANLTRHYVTKPHSSAMDFTDATTTSMLDSCNQYVHSELVLRLYYYNLVPSITNSHGFPTKVPHHDIISLPVNVQLHELWTSTGKMDHVWAHMYILLGEII